MLIDEVRPVASYPDPRNRAACVGRFDVGLGYRAQIVQQVSNPKNSALRKPTRFRNPVFLAFVVECGTQPSAEQERGAQRSYRSGPGASTEPPRI
jgi:hypothetical protein